MNQPVFSIDVAKGKSVAAAFLSYHDCMYKPFSFFHSNEDLYRLLTILEQMKNITRQSPRMSSKPPVIIRNLWSRSFLRTVIPLFF
ncbi:hypothetical protein XI25_00575 [Paenibacillus sp. DMB20]|nr:hypothetical protein XI25_00575 [Paenibacillus sp. DMB20]